MRRVLQLLALALTVGLCAFFACRAQPSSRGPAARPAAAATPAADAAAAVDAPPPPPPPEVYLPASKSGGVFIEHQQAPR